MKWGSKLICGQATAMLGGDGWCQELCWDECPAELVAVFRTLLFSVPHFQLASLPKLLLPRLGASNNHFSWHKATGQNHHSSLTDCWDRIQRLFPTWAHVSRSAD